MKIRCYNISFKEGTRGKKIFGENLLHGHTTQHSVFLFGIIATIHYFNTLSLWKTHRIETT